jgi:hypothetical protein
MVGGKLGGAWSEENQEEHGLRKTRMNMAVTDDGKPRGTWPRWTENQEHGQDGEKTRRDMIGMDGGKIRGKS